MFRSERSNNSSHVLLGTSESDSHKVVLTISQPVAELAGDVQIDIETVKVAGSKRYVVERSGMILN
jgi:hypothetical protein